MVFGEGRWESYLDCQVQATLFLGVRVQEAVFASRSSYKNRLYSSYNLHII